MSQPMKIRTIGLVGKDNSPAVTDALLTLLHHLRQVCEGQLMIWVKAESAAAIGVPELAASFEKIAEVADVAIVIGGDGTLISAARRLAEHDVPLVGINQGRLGFMTDIARADMLTAVDRLLAGEFTADQRLLLDAQVWRGGQQVFQAVALNDVVVSIVVVSFTAEPHYHFC